MADVVSMADFRGATSRDAANNVLVFEQFPYFNSSIGRKGLDALVKLRDAGWIIYANAKYFPDKHTSAGIVARGNEKYMASKGKPLFYAYDRETGQAHQEKGGCLVVEAVPLIDAHAVITGLEEAKLLLLNCEEDQVRLTCDNVLYAELITGNSLRAYLHQLARGGMLGLNNGYEVNQAPVLSMASAICAVFAFTRQERDAFLEAGPSEV